MTWKVDTVADGKMEEALQKLSDTGWTIYAVIRGGPNEYKVIASRS